MSKSTYRRVIDWLSNIPTPGFISATAPGRWFYYPRGRYNPIEYIVSNSSIVLFHAGLSLFALTELFPEPPESQYVEWMIIAISMTVIGVVLVRLLWPRVDNPLTRWVYLLSLLSANITAIGFMLGHGDVSLALRTVVLLLIGAGCGVSLQLHIAYGGNKSRKKPPTDDC